MKECPPRRRTGGPPAGDEGFPPQARPNLILRPKGALFSSPKGSAFGPPFSFVPHCAQRSGGPFYFIDSGRPTQGLPASDAALAARPRWAVAASPPKRERAAGAVQERTRQGANRGISAEMQCGTASRAARDLPARPVPRKTAGAPGMERPEFIPSGSPPHHARRGMEPCSPVNPFFLDGRFGLGEGASHALGGVSGRILASGRIARFLAPTIFLWYRQAAPSRAAKPPRPFWAAPRVRR